MWLLIAISLGASWCSICYSIKCIEKKKTVLLLLCWGSYLVYNRLFIYPHSKKVYHICALRKKFSFLCPNGTIFDQRVFVCNWWHNVDCASSANYYNLNDLIGISPPTQQQAVKNSINFPSSYAGPSAPTKLVVQQQPQQSVVSQKPLKQIYGPPPSSQGPAAVLQPVLIEEAIKRPSNGLKAPLIQTLASSAY